LIAEEGCYIAEVLNPDEQLAYYVSWNAAFHKFQTFVALFCTALWSTKHNWLRADNLFESIWTWLYFYYLLSSALHQRIQQKETIAMAFAWIHLRHMHQLLS